MRVSLLSRVHVDGLGAKYLEAMAAPTLRAIALNKQLDSTAPLP